ncbi:MAG: hypothetical protein R2684_09135 [Pyrinomonadaceae bacterium]
MLNSAIFALVLIATALTFNVFADCEEQTNVTKRPVAVSCELVLTRMETRESSSNRGKFVEFPQGFLMALRGYTIYRVYKWRASM